MLNSALYAIVRPMDNDFRTTDPILDDQRWWGTNPIENANQAAYRRESGNDGFVRPSRRAWNKRFWVIWSVVVLVLALNFFSKVLY